LAQKKPGPIGRRDGHVQLQEQAVVGNIPRRGPAVRRVRKKLPSWRKEEEPGDGSDLTTGFQEAVSFL
jgi:hypothetical protein